MQKWLKISLLLSSFGFFKELRPSEPFVAEFLSGPWRNISIETINQEIYPLGTYSILTQLVIVFLITDILRYKPIIVLMACAGIIQFGMLLWTKTLLELKISQLFYGTFISCEVAYYTYIYAKVEKRRYHIVTGHTRAAILCGRFLAAVLAQFLTSFDLMDYRELHFISFGSLIISLFVAIALPTVKRSLYFYSQETKIMDETHSTANNFESKNETCSTKASDIELCKTTISSQPNTNSPPNTKDSAEPSFSWRHAYYLLWQHIIAAYTNKTVLRWSCWWALATCGQLQVVSYVQLLWKEIDVHTESYYNGGVEATVTLIGAAGAMTAGMLNSNRYKKWHTWILTICSLLMGAFLIISAITHLIMIAYVMYIIFGVVYFFVITIATATVAENLAEDSFALIFGINTVVATALQSLMTFIVITVCRLNIREQYIVYGCYFLILAVSFGMAVFLSIVCKKFKIFSKTHKERNT